MSSCARGARRHSWLVWSLGLGLGPFSRSCGSSRLSPRPAFSLCVPQRACLCTACSPWCCQPFCYFRRLASAAGVRCRCALQCASSGVFSSSLDPGAVGSVLRVPDASDPWGFSVLSWQLLCLLGAAGLSWCCCGASPVLAGPWSVRRAPFLELSPHTVRVSLSLTTGSPPWAFRDRDHLSNSLKELHSSS